MKGFLSIKARVTLWYALLMLVVTVLVLAALMWLSLIHISGPGGLPAGALRPGNAADLPGTLPAGGAAVELPAFSLAAPDTAGRRNPGHGPAGAERMPPGAAGHGCAGSRLCGGGGAGGRSPDVYKRQPAMGYRWGG